MIKKLSNKQLLFVLGVALFIYGVTTFIRNMKGENTFHTALIPKIDSAQINGMLIFPKKKGSKVISFTYNGKEWRVSQGDINARCEPRSTGYVIQQLKQVSPDRLAANDVEHWKDFDVTDTGGTRVVLLHDKDTVVDVMVGRFSYITQERRGMTYVRLRDQKEVYGVEGFLAMNIAEDFNAWRDRKILKGEPQAWDKISFMYPDSGFVVTHDTTGWKVDGSTPDSLARATIMTAMTQQNFGTFIDKFDTNKKPAAYSVKFESKSEGTFIVKAYDNDSLTNHIITSSINPGSYMNGNNNNMFHALFVSKKIFFHHPEQPKASQPKKVRK